MKHKSGVQATQGNDDQGAWVFWKGGVEEGVAELKK